MGSSPATPTNTTIMSTDFDHIPLGIVSAFSKQLPTLDFTEIIDFGSGRGVKVLSTGETVFRKNDPVRYHELLRSIKSDKQTKILQLYTDFTQKPLVEQQKILKNELNFCIQRAHRLKDKLESENAKKRPDAYRGISESYDVILEVIVSIRQELTKIH